jgi:uncharacterized protein (DUF427 family)
MDTWLEEDEEAFVHPRDPYHRIDILDSSRQVRVVIAGETVAETTRGRFLFETTLPVRYYIPKSDVRLDLLEESGITTACAYKGTTSKYWRMKTASGAAKEVAWCYDSPSPEVARIAGLISFSTSASTRSSWMASRCPARTPHGADQAHPATEPRKARHDAERGRQDRLNHQRPRDE